MKFKNALEAIGNTPLVELSNLKKKLEFCGNIYAKVEYFNPGGSIKDRAALSMINDAEEKGLLKKGSVIIEPTSGNTGIGIALISSLRGYKTILVMPESMSIERRKLLKMYGAEIVLTPASLGMKGSIEKAEELNRITPNSIILKQFDNDSNSKAHYLTTGPEIYKDLEGKVDYFVAGIGTGGTITGTGRFLKEKNNQIKVIGVEPSSSPYLTQNKAGSHKIQGIGAGFKPNILDLSICDEIIPVDNEDAYRYAKMVCKEEGLLVGISSGAALKAAIDIALMNENNDKNIVVIFPDSGDRYMSTELFED